MASSETRAQVQDYYGNQLQTSQDLLTNACCTDDIPLAHRRILAQLESEVLEKYYGCGVCIPEAIPLVRKAVSVLMKRIKNEK